MVNHRFPSGPEAMSCGPRMVLSVKVDTTPAVVIRPIEPPLGDGPWLVNQRSPSGAAAVIPWGELMPGPAKLDTTPDGVIRPMVLLPTLVNHRFPSGPAVMLSGWLMPGSVKLETTPPGVMRPMVLLNWLVNHRFPSGPAVIRRAR